MGRPNPNIPGTGYYVLITAAHVLEGIPTDIATLSLRVKEENNYKRLFYQINIRDKGNPIWVRHPIVDVAAMNVELPKGIDIELFSTDILSNDDHIKNFEIHPGDELFVLGYPLNVESNPSGFPVLRSARIANYPLIPTASYPTFLLDLTIFPGNSGGPVILDSRNRIYNGTTNVGSVNMVMGIISQELKNIEKIDAMNETILKQHQMSLAVAIHASYIKNVLEMLPMPK